MDLLAWTEDGIAPGDILHIYLEGDGVPWKRGLVHATNPTSKKMLALQLMQIDPYPAVYLNRPCYGFDKVPRNCKSTLWTSARYSTFVITQIDQGITELKQRYQARKVILIGHSGGGTLAMLIARKRNDVVAIMTIGANLDHAAWTHHFGFEPLFGSENPALAPPLPDDILRWHLFGTEDRQVPLEVARGGARHDPQATVQVIENYDHHCCWKETWVKLVKRFRQAWLSQSGEAAGQPAEPRSSRPGTN